jgi:predicted lipid-binding transport protein (Tim44 family)
MIGPWGGHGMMRGGFPGLGLLGALLSCLLVITVIALVVWLIVKLVRSSSSTPAQSAPAQSAPPPAPPPQIQQPDPVLETLRRRLAITAEEFDELRLKLGV